MVSVQIIGNPPWVEFHKVKNEYRPLGLQSSACNNLWAYVVERSYCLLEDCGRLGLIVPMSLVCTDRMRPIQSIIRSAGRSWVSNYESDSNPGQLFNGVKQNVTILLAQKRGAGELFTTRLNRFFQEYRYVFDTVQYTKAESFAVPFGFAKVSSEFETKLLRKMFSKPPLATRTTQTATHPILVHRVAHYFIKCLDFSAVLSK